MVNLYRLQQAEKEQLKRGPTVASRSLVLGGIMSLPRVVLKHLSWICEETCSELRSLPSLSDGICQIQVCFTATCLHTGHSVGRRHVRRDTTEEGLAPARVAFRDYWTLPLYYLVGKCTRCFFVNFSSDLMVCVKTADIQITKPTFTIYFNTVNEGLLNFLVLIMIICRCCIVSEH